MKSTAVVILNWNGRNFLEKFLPSVMDFSLKDADVFIIDNNSEDDSLVFLRNNFPEIEIIRTGRNLGFAGGYNEGLRKLKESNKTNMYYEYYMLLNSDVEVTPGWLKPLVTLMQNDKSTAACQPKMLNFNIRDEFEYAGAAGGYIDKYGYPFCRGRIFNQYEKDRDQYNDYREIFWASGACLFIRADLFHDAGGFDPDFFAHMEEIDLCWRLKNRGYKIMYCPGSVIYHIGAGTLEKVNPKKTYYNFRNNLILVCKNHAKKYWAIKIIIRMVLDSVAALKFLFADGITHFSAVLKAHFSFYRSFPKTWRKRKILQKEIKWYATTGVYNGSVVAEFYLKGRKRFWDLDVRKFL
ncbi:MAG: glycosyltransferase family 2 protein [Bacteroidetes bacterium]|nr:glycosyltransferase family 2 protein [Bacteroidota bacterium]